MNPYRRRFTVMCANAALALVAPHAYAQARPHRIGFLWEFPYPHPFSTQHVAAFKLGMRELGYAEGTGYVLEHRAPAGATVQLAALATELVALKVDIIVTSGTPSALAARDASSGIPVLITTVGDAVAAGLATSLARPGGNVTGLTQGVGSALYSKRLDLLRQIVPGIRTVAFLYDPGNASNAAGVAQFEADCRKLDLKPVRAPVRKLEELGTAFNAIRAAKVEGLIVATPATFLAWLDAILKHVATHRMPAIHGATIFAEAGGMIGYGTNLPDLYRRAAGYADKIFKGARPGDLPIEQPNTFELVVNLKTAKALGITIPPSVLLQANRVIE